MNNELRWKQRFQNFEKAFEVFQRRIDEYERDPYSESHQMSLIQAFEILIELSWKTLKDYLENEGYDRVKNSKQAIRQAFQDEIIHDAESWMEALQKRNITSHTYEPEILIDVIEFIENTYYPIVRDLYYNLKKEL